jgi:DNA-binding CsgD family transcriptional regulator
MLRLPVYKRPGKRPTKLTTREKQIVDLVVNGCSNAVIAQLLGSSVNTIKGHLFDIFDKAGCESRLQLALKFSRGRSREEHEGLRVDLLMERSELTHQLAAVNEKLELLGGARHEENSPVVYDLSACAGAAGAGSDPTKH